MNSNNVWLTRKYRIETAERLKRLDFYSQFFLMYYSLIIVLISIFDKKNTYTELIMFSSIILLVLSIYIYAQNFKERSINLKHSYIDMQDIESQLRRLEKSTSHTSKKGERYKQKYYSILKNTENHDNCDYLKVTFDNQNNQGYNNPKLSFCEHLNLFFLCRLKYKLFFLILFLLPIIVFVI